MSDGRLLDREVEGSSPDYGLLGGLYIQYIENCKFVRMNGNQSSMLHIFPVAV